MGNQRERPPPTSHCSSKECGKTRRNSLNDEIQSLSPNSSLIALRFPGVCPLSPPLLLFPWLPLKRLRRPFHPLKATRRFPVPAEPTQSPRNPQSIRNLSYLTTQPPPGRFTPQLPLSPPGGPHQAAGRGGTALLRATDCPLAAQCAPGASQTVLWSPHRHQLRRPLLRG